MTAPELVKRRPTPGWRFILGATLLIWLSSVAVLMPSAIALDQGFLSGVLDGTFISFPVVLLGLLLPWLLRKHGQDAVATSSSPLRAGLLSIWFLNAVVLAIVNAFLLTGIVASGRHLGEGALIYVVVLFPWGLSVLMGIAVGIGLILRGRRRARGAQE